MYNLLSCDCVTKNAVQCRLSVRDVLVHRSVLCFQWKRSNFAIHHANYDAWIRVDVGVEAGI